MSDDLVKQLRDDQPVTQDMVSTMQCALQDAAADCIEALEARVSAAEKALSQACASLDGIDATGPQEFYLALAAYQATKEGE
jgi:hypothetical protein